MKLPQLGNSGQRRSTRGSRRAPYRIPGSAPEIPGVDASMGSAGSSNLIGGVGLAGIPDSLPEIQTPDLSSINPGLFRAPIIDVGRLDVARANAKAQAPYQQLEAAEKYLKVAPAAALASPEAAAEWGNLGRNIGLANTGAAIARIRRGKLPGEAPDIPGGPSLSSSGDPLKDKAQAYGTVIAELVKKGVPVEQATTQAHSIIQQQQAQYHLQQLQALTSQSADQMVGENPFLSRYAAAKALSDGVLEPQYAAAKAEATKTAEFDVEDARKPGLERNVALERGRGENQAFREGTVAHVDRTSRESIATQSAQTAGALQRDKDKWAQEIENKPKSERAARDAVNESDLEYKPRLAAQEEAAKNPALAARHREQKAIDTSSSLQSLAGALHLKGEYEAAVRKGKMDDAVKLKERLSKVSKGFDPKASALRMTLDYLKNPNLGLEYQGKTVKEMIPIMESLEAHFQAKINSLTQDPTDAAFDRAVPGGE